jgi:hypothetical protein
MTRSHRAITTGIAAFLFLLPVGALADSVLQGAMPDSTRQISHSLDAAVPAPSIETPLHRLYCVEYARLRSGLAIFGNANQWWIHAKNLYAEVTSPVTDAVMVFARSRRIKKGHVAVVTHIVSPREIRVDQANWQNRGEIDHSIPVLDVSKANDWSRVRVWNIATGTFGTHIYPIRGFIAKGPTRSAQAGL